MLTAKLVFLVEGTKNFETMAIIANVEQIESGTHPNSLRYKILKDYNDLSEKKIKEIKFYINSGFFSSGTLYINDKAYAGLLSLSIDNSVIGMIYSNQAKYSDYKFLKENDYILDIRTV